jgi:hypothetical protein
MSVIGSVLMSDRDHGRRRGDRDIIGPSNDKRRAGGANGS